MAASISRHDRHDWQDRPTDRCDSAPELISIFRKLRPRREPPILDPDSHGRGRIRTSIPSRGGRTNGDRQGRAVRE